MDFTPRQIVAELDKYIVGQEEAKRMVAIALRNRSRRRRVPEPMREEIAPKNILLIGPTGVGKTEIARRLSRLAGAPFVKVEATKYTEVGYVGRDVESMVRDLVEGAVNLVRAEMIESVRPTAEAATTERLLDLLLPPPPGYHRFISERGIEASAGDIDVVAPRAEAPDAERIERHHRSRAKMRQRLQAGELEDRRVEVEVRERGPQVAAFLPGGGGDEMTLHIQEMLDKMSPGRTRRREMTVAEARPTIFEQESQRLIDDEKAVREGLRRAQESGIIFIDEIDKIAGRGGDMRGPDVSREGVQRDILPIVEGSSVFTKYGVVNTDHVLFIAAGAFHATKPSDLIPELQGRFPLRAKLDPLTADDFRRILVEPENALTKQSAALLATDGVELEFTADGIAEIAATAVRVNSDTEQIGARRLHTLLEKVLEDVAFEAPETGKRKLVIDAAFVRQRLADIAGREDLRRFIL
jgi:ATP-dependent HslUV protease ATP-binding subunit HslU